MTTRVPFRILAALPLAFLATGTSAATTFFTSQGTWETAVGGAGNTALLETFDSLPGSVALDTPLSSLAHNGITYDPLGGTNVWVATPVPLGYTGYTNFGRGIPIVSATQLTSNMLTANGDEHFTLTFDTPALGVGFNTFLNGLGSATVTVYDAGGVVGSFVYGAGTFPWDVPSFGVGSDGFPNTREYLGIVSTTPITKIEWLSTDGGVLNTGIDNVSVSPVPEPGTWAMLIAGLGMLGFIARRRARTA